MLSQTRYLTTQQWIYAALTAYLLRLTNTIDGLAGTITLSDVPVTVYLGIKIWKRDAAGNETLLSGANAVAIVSGSNTAALSATWTLASSVALAYGDEIVVRVYGDTFSPPTTLLTNVTCVFHTGMLGGVSLDAVTWTVYYYLTRRLVEGIYIYLFEFGRVAKPSRIENFTWTPAASPYDASDGLTHWE